MVLPSSSWHSSRPFKKLFHLIARKIVLVLLNNPFLFLYIFFGYFVPQRSPCSFLFRPAYFPSGKWYFLTGYEPGTDSLVLCYNCASTSRILFLEYTFFQIIIGKLPISLNVFLHPTPTRESIKELYRGEGGRRPLFSRQKHTQLPQTALILLKWGRCNQMHAFFTDFNLVHGKLLPFNFLLKLFCISILEIYNILTDCSFYFFFFFFFFFLWFPPCTIWEINLTEKPEQSVLLTPFQFSSIKPIF